MDAADVEALRRFSEVPYVVEAPASKEALLGAAAFALRKAVPPGEPTGIAPSRYRRIVAEVRSQVRAGLPAKPGYSIKIFDLGADPEDELADIDRKLRGQGRSTMALVAAKGAFSTLMMTGPRSMSCVVVGFMPELDVNGWFRMNSGIPSVGIPTDSFHRMTILHELGHCLLGPSEARADAFAALMALRDPNLGKDVLPAWAAWRENDEWTSRVTEDDHFTSHAVRAVIERADALLADPAFKTLGMEALASVAATLADAATPGPEGIAEIMSVRRAVRAGVAAAQGPGFPMPGVGALEPWLRARTGIPEFDRILKVRDSLSDRPGDVGAFPSEPGRFRREIGKLAEGGDRVAKAMVAAFDSKKKDARMAAAVAHMHGGAERAKRIPYDFDLPSPYAKAVLASGKGAAPAEEPERAPRR